MFFHQKSVIATWPHKQIKNVDVIRMHSVCELMHLCPRQSIYFMAINAMGEKTVRVNSYVSRFGANTKKLFMNDAIFVFCRFNLFSRVGTIMQRVQKKKRKRKTDLKLDVVFLPYKFKKVLNKPAKSQSRRPSCKKRPRGQDVSVPILDNSSVLNSQDSLGGFGFLDSQDAPPLSPTPSPTSRALDADGLSQLSLCSSSVIEGPLSPSLSVLSPLTQASAPVPPTSKKKRGGFMSKKRRKQYMLQLTADVLLNIGSAWDTMCATQTSVKENVAQALSAAIASTEELREQLR